MPGRIDSLEVFACIVLSTQGNWTTILQNIMAIFGFGAENEFSRDEFHFFIDCLFRGLFKLLDTDESDEVPSVKQTAQRMLLTTMATAMIIVMIMMMIIISIQPARSVEIATNWQPQRP